MGLWPTSQPPQSCLNVNKTQIELSHLPVQTLQRLPVSQRKKPQCLHWPPSPDSLSAFSTLSQPSCCVQTCQACSTSGPRHSLLPAPRPRPHMPVHSHCPGQLLSPTWATHEGHPHHSPSPSHALRWPPEIILLMPFPNSNTSSRNSVLICRTLCQAAQTEARG